ncbi:hypothetical protein THRCLA_00267 [Thraustotheca clavata]|uniref:HMG box domain-containing protein n=1 Tax=Thraustotheca clavata TaxID=74557 RepID=A0A1W0AC14_9STRA|nr:hypothetical protein THRCLA_00267 [Thraustotheca clavata]
MYRHSIEPNQLEELWMEANTEALALSLSLDPPSTASVVPKKPPSLSEINQLDFYTFADDSFDDGSSTSNTIESNHLEPAQTTYSKIDVTSVRAEMQLLVNQLRLENKQLKIKLKAAETTLSKRNQHFENKHNLKLAAKDKQITQLKRNLDEQSGALRDLQTTVEELTSQLADLKFEMKMMDTAYASERAAWYYNSIALMRSSSYIRDVVKEEMPELSFLEISSEIGRRWAALDENDKKRFVLKADDDKARYQREKEDYLPDPAYETQATKSKAARKKKDPNAPKRALSAYFYFCEEHRPATREANPSKKITEIASLLAEMWRALPEKKRAKYNKLAADAKEKYQEKMQAYKEGLTKHEDEHDDEDMEEDDGEDTE